MDNTDIDTYLKSVYYDAAHPASYSGIDKLYRFVKKERKISKARIKQWLTKQEVYVKHKPVRRSFKKLKVVVPEKYYQFDADTVSMVRFAQYNDGYKYILVIIDILSHYCWTCPLKTLTGKEMVSALKKTVETRPQKIRTDSGTEFLNAQVEKYFKSQHIEHFNTFNQTKANYAERMIKTLKSRISKYMHHNRTYQWFKVLSEVTKAYNQTYHRTIKMSPAQALQEDDPVLWKAQYSVQAKTPVPKRGKVFEYKMGDRVKLSFIKSVFDREYDEKWTDETFSISGRNRKQGLAQYTIKDWNNDPISGSFYEAELQRSSLPNDVEYKIEKILKKRTRKGKKEVLVKWEGWHKKFNSWIPEADVKDI